jgi:membrane protein implicated in regulation of membrane protease activity
MEGLSASVVLIAILLGVLLVVVFDVFCLMRLGTADSAHFVPRFAWAVLIVGVSPIGGLVYLLSQRLRRRSPEPIAMRPRPLQRNEAWHGPTLTGYWHDRPTPLGHGVAVMAIAGTAYLVRAGETLAAAGITVILVAIAFLRNTPPG